MENPTLCILPDMVHKTDLQFLFFLVLCFGNNISGLFYTSHLYLTRKYVGYYWTRSRGYNELHGYYVNALKMLFNLCLWATIISKRDFNCIY